MSEHHMLFGEFFVWTGLIMVLGTYMPDPALNTVGWIAAILGGSALWSVGVTRWPLTSAVLTHTNKQLE